jgi:hypothetical protein
MCRGCAFGSLADGVKHDPATHVCDMAIQVGQTHDLAVDGLGKSRHDLDLLPGSLVTGDDKGPICGAWNSANSGFTMPTS